MQCSSICSWRLQCTSISDFNVSLENFSFSSAFNLYRHLLHVHQMLRLGLMRKLYCESFCLVCFVRRHIAGLTALSPYFICHFSTFQP